MGAARSPTAVNAGVEPAPRLESTLTVELGPARFLVGSNSAEFLKTVANIYCPLKDDGSRSHEPVTTFFAHIHPTAELRHWLSQDGVPICKAATQQQLLARLEWSITARAITSLGDHMLIHAGAVGTESQGLLLPAASGAGKTTLVAALMMSGLDYLSDEVAVIDLESQGLKPFAKPLCLREGTWAMIQAAGSTVAAVASSRGPNQPVWYVAPFPRHASAEQYRVGTIVLPSYEPNATSALLPVSRGNALACLIEQSFNLATHRRRGVETLTHIVRDARCYRLVIGELPPAVDLLRRILQRAPQV